MKRIILGLCVLLTVVFIGRAWYLHAHFEIPALHARPAGLQSEEYKRQTQRYTMLIRAIEKAPNEAKNYTALAKILMTEARATGDHPYYYPAAMRCLNEALRRDKNQVEASMLKTSVLLSLHHFAEARELALSLSAQYPDVSALYGMICDANVELGDLDEAYQAVENMMRLRPGLDAYARAAYLREIHGDMQGAWSAMTMAANAGLPGSEEEAWTRTTLGNMYMKYNRWQEARECFLRVLSQRQNYAPALAGMAMIHHQQHQDDLALRTLDSALALQPEVAFVEKKAEIMRDRGMVFQRDSLMHIVQSMMDEDEAAGHVNHAERAIAYSRMNYQPDEALRHALKEISERPNNVTAQYAMALTLSAKGRYAEARSYIQTALQSGTKDPDLLACANRVQSGLDQHLGQ